MPVPVATQCPVPRGIWGDICASDRTSLVEHLPEWNNAICATGHFEDASRLYTYADGRRFVVPLVRRSRAARTGELLYSPAPDWGMGGIVGSGIDQDVVRDVMRDLAALGALRVSVRPDPMTAPLWSGLAMPRLLSVDRVAHVLELDGDWAAVHARFASGMRQNVRKAERAGVTVQLDRTGALLGVHYELFEKSVRRWATKQHEPVPLAVWRAHRRDPLRKLRTMAAHLGARFCQFVGYHEGQPVASIIVLVGRTAHYTRGAMDIDLAGPVRANELLHATAIRHALAEGCSRYHLGESGGSSSLARFKEKLGARAQPYREFRLERLPISRVDRAGRHAVKHLIGFRDL